MKLNVAILILCALCLIEETRSSKILVMVPIPSYSHQVTFRKLVTQLHKHGHEVVFATANPLPINSTRLTQIDISSGYGIMQANEFMKYRFEGNYGLKFMMDSLPDMTDSLTEQFLNNTELRKLYAPDSGTKFDVVLTEFLFMPATYVMAYRFDAPLIGISSLGIPSHLEHVLGGFMLPSHEYMWEMTETGPNLPFWKRLWNYVSLWRYTHKILNECYTRQHAIAERYFGMRLPPLIDIVKNVSLIFVNQADALTPARPKLPNMITFTSFHVKEKPDPLPKDLQRFLDGAKEGFIYFSLGSNARSSDMPMEIQQMFFDVFVKLPYRIVWKYEKEIPVKLDNVYVGKWLPQQSILAHPNIKLFIYQAGLQSTEEAIHFGVPLVAIPILGDQDYQAKRMDALGVGKYLEILTITKDQIDSTIREVITNKQYKEKMLHLRELVNDNPYDLVDNLVWWTEFVIRHKGAPHLRSTLINQPWYQRYDIDIVAFLAIIAFVVVSILVNILARILVHVFKYLSSSVGQKQKISLRLEVHISAVRSVVLKAYAPQIPAVRVEAMKLNAASVLFVLCALCAIEKTRSAKILALVPVPSFSHQVPFRKLMLELQKRGHEVVYATTHPIPNVNLKNFTQIDLSSINADFKTVNFMQFRFDGLTWIEVLEKRILSACESFMENVFNNSEMKRLYAADSDAKFDVVLAEFSYVPSIYSMAHRFDAPLIGLSSLGLLNMYEYALGGFVLPSNEYTWEMGARPGSNLPFWQRVQNYIVMWRTLYKIFNEWVPRHQKMAEHYLGTKLPPLIDIVKNTSLVFVNEPEPFIPARPKLPNIISFTSLHVDENPPPAPKDLQRFMDEAKQGFVYMSFGGNARSADMPMNIQQMFFDVFSKLPYRIIWKYEEDFPVKLDNVYAAKWLPQQSILAHPNIKLFIYQGGLQSTEEAISKTVPVMGFPVLSDQDYMTFRVNALGIGKWLTITTLTREQLDNTIKEVITNKEYKQRITHLRDLIRDTAYNELDRLVWWTEYVIRHKGAPHLRSTLANQPWCQRYDIDVVMFLAIVAFSVALLSLIIIVKLVIYLRRRVSSTASQKKKRN
ncbi:uncharacterized protein LOC100874899 [Megachile rotundata]|uniref:uncharacterized protein LOC100874899 n=1 Tax=Megachile rotundata TaxID=143995 RepID=UPI003FD31002